MVNLVRFLDDRDYSIKIEDQWLDSVETESNVELKLNFFYEVLENQVEALDNLFIRIKSLYSEVKDQDHVLFDLGEIIGVEKDTFSFKIAVFSILMNRLLDRNEYYFYVVYKNTPLDRKYIRDKNPLYNFEFMDDLPEELKDKVIRVPFPINGVSIYVNKVFSVLINKEDKNV